MANILIISGSPTEVSRTSALATYLLPFIKNHGHSVNKITIRDLPPEALIYAQFKNPEILNGIISNRKSRCPYCFKSSL